MTEGFQRNIKPKGMLGALLRSGVATSCDGVSHQEFLGNASWEVVRLESPTLASLFLK